MLGLVWNIRDGSVDWVARLTEIMHSSAAEELLASGTPAVHPPFGALEAHQWRWSRPMTRAQLHSMAASRSYVIAAAEDERARIRRDMNALFDDLGLSADDTVEMPYITHAYRAVRL